jgi:hypothetical protein
MVLCALLQASLVFGGGCWKARDATHWQFGAWWCVVVRGGAWWCVCVVKVSEVSAKVLAFTCTCYSGRSQAHKRQQVSFLPDRDVKRWPTRQVSPRVVRGGRKRAFLLVWEVYTITSWN